MAGSKPKSSSYRADIDGLRALAVIAVILCHVGARGFAGGFFGVDIFFVISGYLIHRELVARVAERALSIKAFYGRRLRRTLPALIVAASVTLAAATLVLLPGDLEALAGSLVGVLASVPNLIFLGQVGYFDPDAATKPLLHTWSLGVEEQFYVVAPLLALVLRSLAPRGRAGAMLGTFAAAFAFTLVLQRFAPSAAFYLMPARLFEFLVGAVLAEDWLPRVRRRWSAELAAGLALGVLVISMSMFDAAVPHPGFATLLPCLAAATLIHVGSTRRTAVGALLSTRGPVGVGRISYSLYLYHWPILVLAGYADLPPSLSWRLGEALLLVTLSVASFRLVEQPFRASSSVWRRRAPSLLPAAVAGLAACCAAVLVFDGWPSRFRPDVDRLAAFGDLGKRMPFREGRCFITSRDSDISLNRDLCLALATDKPNVLLLGDSHAAHLWTGLRDAWPGVNFLQATASGCKPFLAAEGSTRCTAIVSDMLGRFVPTHRLDAVILSALWNEADIEPLRRTITALHADGQRVIVVGPLPRYDVPMSDLLARAVLHGDMDLAARHRLPETPLLDAQLRAAVAPLATYVSPWEAMCPRGDCRLFAAPGVPMQFDYHHLTAQGADVLMATIAGREPDLFGDAARSRLDASRE